MPGSWYHKAQRYGTSGAPCFPGSRELVASSAWPLPLPPPIGCNLSTNRNRKRKPKWRRCVAASIADGPSAILTGSRTRPSDSSDRGSNARFGPVEDRRNNRRLATFTCTLCILQIWWLSPFHLHLRSERHHAAPMTRTGWRCGRSGSARKRFRADRSSSIASSSRRNRRTSRALLATSVSSHSLISEYFCFDARLDSSEGLFLLASQHTHIVKGREEWLHKGPY